MSNVNQSLKITDKQSRYKNLIRQTSRLDFKKSTLNVSRSTSQF